MKLCVLKVVMTNLTSICALLVPIIFYGYVVDCATVEVNTDLGQIMGVVMETRLGEEFQAYRGIRYAEPPIDLLRFASPRPVKPWKPLVFNATVDGAVCPQLLDKEYLYLVSEDCLVLNVYTKDVKARKPVIVYIHPGGFYSMSSESTIWAGPQYLMERDIVLVSLNYRLGTLGFLATGTVDAPGNAGLKDQVVALRWIQKHIVNFGGDPNSITLMGYSAGSLSIGYHMLSPMSKGLFHRGIAMSGSPFGQWDYHNDGLMLAERQARLLNCSVTPVSELVNCLRKKPMLEFVNTHNDMFDFKWNPLLNWEPVIEPDFGQERFLDEDPVLIAQRGNFYKVPLIIGINQFEGLQFADVVLSNETTRSLFINNFEKYASIAFLFSRNKNTDFRSITDKIRSFYLKNDSIQYPESLMPFGQMYSDGVGFHRYIQLMSPHVPVYTYLFTYKGRFGHFKQNNITIGPVHHDDLQYLLHVGYLTPIFKHTDPEHTIVERMTRMWFEFAKKGNPNNHTDEYLKDVNWPLYTEEKMEYLDIGSQLVTKDGGIYLERFLLWDKLFPLRKL